MKVHNCLKLGITRSIYLNNDNRMFRGGEEQKLVLKGVKMEAANPRNM